MSKFKYSYDKIIKSSLPCIHIDLPIYKCSVEVLLPKESRVVVKRWDDDKEYDAKTYNYLESHGLVLVSFLSLKPEVVAHEFLHAVQMIMVNIGHDMDGEDEPSAYLLGHLIKEFNRLKKKEVKSLDLKKKKE